MKIKNMLIALLLLMHSSSILAKYTSKDSQDAMNKINFLIGKWQGSGWILKQNKEKSIFNQTEIVEWKLDKSTILIEGQGRDVDSNEITHHALAVISWQNKLNKYRFSSTLANGRDGLFEGYTNDKGQFVWVMNSEYGKRRFIIEINANEEWFEVGEFSKDGESWFQFFEMTLKKVD